MRFEFREWRPDLGYKDNPGVTEAKNVAPAVNGYLPLNELATTTNALDSECLGAISAFSKAADVYNYAGSRHGLYELVDNTWTSRSSSGSFYYEPAIGQLTLQGPAATVEIATDDYLAEPGELVLSSSAATVAITGSLVFEATPTTLLLTGPGATVTITQGAYNLSSVQYDFWEFVKWDEGVIAVGGVTINPQKIAFGGSAFADLSGSPPKARHISVVRDFVVLGNLDESGTLYPSRLRWSGINDETHWTTSASKQSDYQDLAGGGGWIMAIRGGHYGVIVQEQSTRRMDYVGPPVVFKLDLTLPHIGTPAPNSVVRWGDLVFMLAQHGFVAIEQGWKLNEIGANRINRWFWDNVDSEQITRMVGAVDRINRRIMWVFPGLPNDGGKPNAGVLFDMDSGNWSRFESDIEWIWGGMGEGLSLDALDAVNTSLDALPISLDSRRWMAGGLELSAFGHDHESGTFDGDIMDAIIETMERQILPARRAYVHRAHPEIDAGSTIALQAGARNSMADAVTWGGSKSAERDGGYIMRSLARYHRFRATITGGFERAQAISVSELRDGGAYG